MAPTPIRRWQNSTLIIVVQVLSWPGFRDKLKRSRTRYLNAYPSPTIQAGFMFLAFERVTTSNLQYYGNRPRD